jgi:hypothetical protein
MPSRRRLLSVNTAARILAIVALAPSLAFGQTPTPARPTWTVEIYGGFGAGRVSTGGTSALPNPGAPITTSSPIFPSWEVPSWFFGDGAAFLNNVNQEFSLTDRITPLDAALDRSGLAASGAPYFGVRFRRPLTMLQRRFAIEAGVDVMAASARIGSDLQAAAGVSAASFESAFGALLATGPFTNAAVDATTTVAGGTSREIVLTGGLEYEFAPFASLTPYVVGGGGLIVQAGTSPAVTLTGHYEFLIAGAVPINETDQLTLRHEQRTGLVGMAGGGVRRAISDRWTVQIDARALFGRDRSSLVIDAAPVSVTGTPPGFVESFTYPNLQFSNHPSTGRQSTLSGSLQGFEAFTGGFQTRIRITIGVSTRF